jgi:hypothetical protein
MSIEVRIGDFKFLPPQSILSEVFSRPDPIWFYNPLHDIESIWWLMTFFLYNKDFTTFHKGRAIETSADFSESDSDRSVRIRNQKQFVEGLFVFNDARHDAFASNLHLRRRLALLSPAVSAIGPWLEEARIQILQAFQRAELAPELIDRNVARDLYGKLQFCLQKCAGLADTDEYSINIAMSVYQAVRTLQDSERTSVKRKPETVTNAAGALVEGPSSVPRGGARAPTDNETAESQAKRTKTI